MAYRDDRAALRERVDQLEAELAEAHAREDRARELARQLAWARSELTRLQDSRSRARGRWILPAALIVMVGGGVAVIRAVAPDRGARPAPTAVEAPFAGPRDVETLAAADLGCPREELQVSHFGENQQVVTGCGKCAHYAYAVGLWALGPTRVLDPETLKYTCNRAP
jgi:hypothetical protein